MHLVRATLESIKGSGTPARLVPGTRETHEDAATLINISCRLWSLLVSLFWIPICAEWGYWHAYFVLRSGFTTTSMFKQCYYVVHTYVLALRQTNSNRFSVFFSMSLDPRRVSLSWP